MVDRLDMVVGSFPVWTEHLRLFSESGKNPLFTNGQKEAVNLRVTLDADLLRITVSLLSDPAKSITGYYKLSQDMDLTSGYIGLRNQHSDVMFDNFTVITEHQAAAAVGETITSGEYCTTMKQVLQSVNENWEIYTQNQQDAVKALCEQYPVTKNWELTNIYPVENDA